MANQDLKIRVLFDRAEKFTAPVEKGLAAAKRMKTEVNQAVQESMASIRKMQRTFNATETLEGMHGKLKDTTSHIERIEARKAEVLRLAQSDSGTFTAEIKELPKLEAELRQTQMEEKKLISRTEQLETSLKNAGVDTTNLAKEQKRLQTDILRAEDALDKKGGALQQAQSRMARYHDELKSLQSTERELSRFNQIKKKYQEQKTAVYLATEKLKKMESASEETSKRQTKAIERKVAKVKKLTHETDQQKLVLSAMEAKQVSGKEASKRHALAIEKQAAKVNKLNLMIQEQKLSLQEMEAKQTSGSQASKRHAEAIKRQTARVEKYTHAANQQKQTLKAAESALEQAGLDTKNLANAQAELERRMQSANSDIKKQTSHLLKLADAERKAKQAAQARRNARWKFDQRMQSASNMMVASGGAMYAGKSMADKVMQPADQAIEDEAAFASVKKVVDFEDVEEANAFKNTLQAMASSEIPIAAEGLYAIAESGGQLGIAKDKLKDFTRVTAVMSTAFDMEAEKAGDSMAKLSNIYQLPISGMEEVGDAINHLSNNTAAKADHMVDALSRIGGVSKGFGLTVIQSSALANSMLALGKTPEVAATGINALLLKMQTATNQGKPFQKGLAKIGLTAEDMEKKVRTNAQGALIDFLETLKDLPEEKQMNVIGQMFGAEYADDISALVGGLNEYKKALDLVSDSDNYTFSMELEFDNKIATTKAQKALLENQLDRIKTTIGYALLPMINDMISKARPMLDAIMEWTQKNPELTATLLQVALGGSVLVASLGALGIAIAVLRGPFAIMVFALKLIKTSTMAATAALWLKQAALFALRSIVLGGFLLRFVASMTLLKAKTVITTTALVLQKVAMIALRGVALGGFLLSLATSMGILKTRAAATTAVLVLQKTAMIALRSIALGSMLMAMAGSMTIATTAAVALKIALWAVAGALAILTSPITLVIAAIAALAVGAYYLYTRWEQVKNYLSETTWGQVLLGVINAVTSPIDTLNAAIGWMGDKWNQTKTYLAETTWGQVLLAAINALLLPFNALISIVKSVGAMWDSVKSSLAETSWGKSLLAMINSVKSGLSALSNAWNTAKKMTADKLTGGWQSVKSFVGLGEPDGKRAAGGSVSAGSFYQVNELGPELLTMAGKTYLMANQAGNITPLIQKMPAGFKASNDSIFNQPANDPVFNQVMPQVAGSLALAQEIDANSNNLVTTTTQTHNVARKQQITVGDIHIHPTPGMDEIAVGEEVKRVMQELMDEQGNNNNALYDLE